MKTLIVLALLFVSCLSFAQDYDANVPYTFEIGETYYLVADSVNVRKSASTKGDLVTVLPLGTEVKILSQSKTITRLNNFNMYWYEVSFAGKKGYIWGGKIAKTSFRSTKNPEIVFHFGLDIVKIVDEWEESHYQIRVEQKGKQLQKLNLKGFGHAMKTHTLTNYGNRGLTNVDDVLYLEGYGEACGDEAGSVVLIHTNGKLTEATRLTNFADVPVFSHDILYFPSDMKGMRDCVVFFHESGEWIDTDEETGEGYIQYDEQKKIVYKWDGSKLVEQKTQRSR